MKHRLLLVIGIGLTVIADIAVILMSYGWLDRTGWILLASLAAALAIFNWSARVSSGWGGLSLLIFFGQGIFLPFADFAGFGSTDPFFPLLILPWFLLGAAQFIVVCVRIRLELNAEKRNEGQNAV